MKPIEETINYYVAKNLHDFKKSMLFAFLTDNGYSENEINSSSFESIQNQTQQQQLQQQQQQQQQQEQQQQQQQQPIGWQQKQVEKQGDEKIEQQISRSIPDIEAYDTPDV